MVSAYKHIRFEQQHNPGKKTAKWICINTSGEELGTVEWYGQWRQYCFCSDVMIYSRSCLHDIEDFLEKIKDVRQ